MTSALVEVRFGGSPVMVDVTFMADAAIDTLAASLRTGRGELEPARTPRLPRGMGC